MESNNKSENLRKHRDMWLHISYSIFIYGIAIDFERLCSKKREFTRRAGDFISFDCYLCDTFWCDNCPLAIYGYMCSKWYPFFDGMSWSDQVFMSAKCALINSDDFYNDFVDYFIDRISKESKFYISSYVGAFKSLCEQWFPFFALNPEDILRLNKLKEFDL